MAERGEAAQEGVAVEVVNRGAAGGEPAEVLIGDDTILRILGRFPAESTSSAAPHERQLADAVVSTHKSSS